MKPQWLISAIILLATVGIAGQETVGKKSTLELIDKFGRMNAETRSAAFDVFFQRVEAEAQSIGYVFLYCGMQCRYGEIEAHQRGIEIKMGFRKFDRTRLVVVNAGFRESFETELWLSRDPAIAPRPKSTVHIKSVRFSQSAKQPLFELYFCCDDYSDVWKSIKP